MEFNKTEGVKRIHFFMGSQPRKVWEKTSQQPKGQSKNQSNPQDKKPLQEEENLSEATTEQKDLELTDKSSQEKPKQTRYFQIVGYPHKYPSQNSEEESPQSNPQNNKE
ncbi:MAG: hypothetical protein NTW73_00255 [Candidatus Parcubacteria bacterium]|nr:hypothetical protein [Candidatus Parcubacteria bacterium]